MQFWGDHKYLTHGRTHTSESIFFFAACQRERDCFYLCVESLSDLYVAVYIKIWNIPHISSSSLEKNPYRFVMTINLFRNYIAVNKSVLCTDYFHEIMALHADSCWVQFLSLTLCSSILDIIAIKLRKEDRFSITLTCKQKKKKVNFRPIYQGTWPEIISRNLLPFKTFRCCSAGSETSSMNTLVVIGTLTNSYREPPFTGLSFSDFSFIFDLHRTNVPG